MSDWLTSVNFAALAGISHQKARAALGGIASTRRGTWRGTRLIVQTRHGRGGQSGRQYIVLASSLPVPLQLAWKELRAGIEAPLKLDVSSARVRDWRLFVIQPAIGLTGPERATAVRTIAGRDHMDPQGRPKRVPETTLYRWLRLFEEEGAAGLQRRKRSDAGGSLVAISRRWDAAVPFDAVTKHRIGEQLVAYVRGLRVEGAQPKLISGLARTRLMEWTRAAGFDPGTAELQAACAVPLDTIKAERVFEQAHIYRTDRKAHDDARLRHRRTRSFAPMQCVVGDVHPMDVLYTRDDGSTATARLIAWQDLGTDRVWADVVALPRRRGVTNADIVQSFISMVGSWGLMRQLYVDNGKEYICTDFINDALRLVDAQGHRLLRVDGSDHDPGRAGTRRTRPYNAQSKPIEGFFAHLEGGFFRHIPGHIGGNRMRKKSANIGRPPLPFNGTFAELRTLVALALRTYHELKRGKASATAGRSPFAAYQDWIDRGWTRTPIDTRALSVAFSTELTRDNRGGGVEVNGKVWTCPALRRHMEAKVRVRVPKFHEWAALPVYDLAGGLLGFAEPQVTTDFFDPAGARLSDEYKADRATGARQLARAAPPVNVLAEMAHFVEAQPPEPVAPDGPMVGLSEEAAEIAARMGETPDAKKARKRVELEQRERRIVAGNARLASFADEL